MVVGVTDGGKKIFAKRVRTGFVAVMDGQLPNILKGFFTTYQFLETAVNVYLANKPKTRVKPKTKNKGEK